MTCVDSATEFSGVTMSMQLDMFAVELGAAILMQFKTSEGIVRLLADAGEARHHVDAKLETAVDAFNPDNKSEVIHIDLIIGTHYDSDHLAGLVDIINNPKVTIGEAWLPPVANDSELKRDRSEPHDEDLLALQFAGEDGDAVLERYLNYKAKICTKLADAEHRGDELRDLQRGNDKSGDGGFHSRKSAYPTESLALTKDFFEWHLMDASQTLGRDPGGHAEEPIVEPWLDEVNKSYDDPLGFRVYRRPIHSLDNLVESWSHSGPDVAEADATALALIRRSASKDAINATSLAAVVKALRSRHVPISCRTIADGTPRRFSWQAKERCFTPSNELGSNGPELLLLGPSDGLVKKHWKRLPIGEYALKIAYQALPIEQITASNQLSYILRVDFNDARVLLSGDAGCVDFKLSLKEGYHKALIEALARLDVIQVAHHGGHNAHFYRCLLAAGYASQRTTSYLLLSHAVADKHRPSEVFAKFIEQVRSNTNDVRLLFTSQPTEPKVRDFKTLFGAVAGASALSGDVRMLHNQMGWTVKAHAVAAP